MRACARGATMTVREDGREHSDSARSSPRPREAAMDALIVYESMYGNTRAIAEAIAEGYGEGASARPVRDAGVPPGDLDLLVVGGPTQIHGMTTSFSRRVAISAGLKEGHVAIEPDAVDAPG